MTANMRKIDDIQVLRACAILMVVINHARVVWPFIPKFFHNGFTGVNLFFVISGFVISTSSLDAAQDGIRNFVPQFMLKRIFRILPAACFWLLVYYLVFLLVDTNLSSEIFRIITFTYNYDSHVTKWLGHYWSLMVEEHFYFVFAFIFPVLLKRNLVVPFCIFIIFITIIYFRPNAGSNGHTEANLDYFAAGIIIACVRKAWKPVLSRLSYWALVLLSLIALATIFVLFSFPVPEAYTILLVMSSLVVAIGALDKDLILPIPWIRQGFVWIGERSYSIYLSQSLLIYAEYWASHNTRWGEVPVLYRIGCLFLAIFATGAFSYQLIEVQFDQLRKRLQLAWG